MKVDAGATQTEVLVVGAGPSGATASLALARYGVANICLSKYSSTSQSPRAHITNQRAMEILRHFGLEQQAMALATPQHLMGDHIYCTSLTGMELGRMKSWHTHPRFKAQHDLISPCSMVDLTQDLLEPILVSAATRAGARVRFDTEMIDFDQDEDGVTVRILDRLTGLKSTVRARYMIGADGANSRVVDQLELPLQGVTGIAANLGIGFKADLSHLVAHRSGVLYWIVQPGRGVGGYPIAGLRMVRAWDRWITTWGYDVKGPPPALSNAEATAIVHRIIGDPSIPVEIENIYTWTMNRVYADAYGRGRVFCVGDAVHRHPPMNGLGSNTSIQDSFNLSWKLAMVLRGNAGEALLNSYEQERLPVGHSVVRRAADNFSVYAPVAQALGFKPGQQSAEQFESLASKLADPSPEGQARRAALRVGVADNIIGFGALGGEHNQFYRSRAVVEDQTQPTDAGSDLDVAFEAAAGRRLPHVWLTKRGRRVSTLDLCLPGEFTLLTGVSGQFWIETANELKQSRSISVNVRSIGPGQEFDDAYGDFARMCLADERGAILVRPDLFVAWRALEKPENPALALEDALARVLAWSAAPSQSRQVAA